MSEAELKALAKDIEEHGLQIPVVIWKSNGGHKYLLDGRNRLDALDPGLRRPGRFDREVIVPLPDRAERAAILSSHARGKDLGPDAVAADLGLGDPNELTRLLKASSRLQESGLSPLLRDATITRTEWDTLDGRPLSRFQEVSRDLELGTGSSGDRVTLP